MRTISMRTMRRGSVVLVVALAVPACVEEPTKPPSEIEFPVVLPGTVRATLVAEPRLDQTVLATVRIDAHSLKLGAYQGRLTFDHRNLTLVNVILPEDGYRFINTEGADQGLIRFAGFTTEGFTHPVAMVLEFESSGSVDLTGVNIELEVIGDIEGSQVEKRRILEPAKVIAR